MTKDRSQSGDLGDPYDAFDALKIAVEGGYLLNPLVVHQPNRDGIGEGEPPAIFREDRQGPLVQPLVPEERPAR